MVGRKQADERTRRCKKPDPVSARCQAVFDPDGTGFIAIAIHDCAPLIPAFDGGFGQSPESGRNRCSPIRDPGRCRVGGRHSG
jgi:hypothetical protein